MTAWSKNVRGEMTDTPEENATVFQDFFNDLFRNDAEGGNVDEECAKMDQREVDRAWGAPKEWEMIEALKQMKHTASGVSGMTATAWQARGENVELRKGTLKILTECWDEEEVPKEWMVFHVAVLFKKGARSDVGNCRGISMAETLPKLHTSTLKKRLESYYEAVVPGCCNGFRRAQGRIDSCSC